MAPGRTRGDRRISHHQLGAARGKVVLVLVAELIGRLGEGLAIGDGPAARGVCGVALGERVVTRQ